ADERCDRQRDAGGQKRNKLPARFTCFRRSFHFLTFSLSGLIIWAATTAAPVSYCVRVVVQLMHFCFQMGRDSDRSHLPVKKRIQILSRARRWIGWAAATVAAREFE